MISKCILCGWEWKSRVENPAQCPRCKRYDWNKKRGDTNGDIRIRNEAGMAQSKEVV